jgi:hypothetical protein
LNLRIKDGLSKRFEKMARELECDEDMGAFRQKLARIVRQAPKDNEKPTKTKRQNKEK